MTAPESLDPTEHYPLVDINKESPNTVQFSLGTGQACLLCGSWAWALLTLSFPDRKIIGGGRPTCFRCDPETFRCDPKRRIDAAFYCRGRI